MSFDKTSNIELASRTTGGGERLMLAMRGSKNEKETSVASILLTKEEVLELVNHLNGWINTDIVAK